MIKKAIKIAGNSDDIMFIKIIGGNGGGGAIEDFLKLVSIPEPDAPDVGEIIIFRDIADDIIKSKDENGDVKVLVPKIPDFLTLKEITTPGKPEAGSIIVFLDESDKVIKTIDENEDVEPLIIDIDSLTLKSILDGTEKILIQNSDGTYNFIEAGQILPPKPAFKAVLLDNSNQAFFYSLKETTIAKNNKDIVAVDLEFLIALENLDLNDNQLTAIDIPDTLTALESLDLYGNQLTAIDIPDTLTALQYLYLNDNQLTAIDIPDTLTALQYLYLSGNQLTTIVIPDTLTALQNLYLGGNQLTDIDIPDTLTALQQLYLSGNQLTAIDIPDTLTALQYLNLNDNQLSQVAIDTLLANIDASGATNGFLNIAGGTNAIPTDGASNANIISLISKGWGIQYNV